MAGAYVFKAPGWDSNPHLDIEAPPETVVISDSFTRSDTPFPPSGTSLGNTPVGAKAWTRGSSDSSPTYDYGGVISSGRIGLVASTLTGTRRIFAYFNSGLTDFRYTTRFVTGVKDGTAAAVPKFIDASNYLMVKVNGTKWALYKRTTAGGEQLIYTAATLADAADGDEISVAMIGSQITLRVNGVSTPTQTVTEFAAATRCGYGQTFVAGSYTVPTAFWDNPTVSSFGSWADA